MFLGSLCCALNHASFAFGRAVFHISLITAPWISRDSILAFVSSRIIFSAAFVVWNESYWIFTVAHKYHCKSFMKHHGKSFVKHHGKSFVKHHSKSFVKHHGNSFVKHHSKSFVKHHGKRSLSPRSLGQRLDRN